MQEKSKKEIAKEKEAEKVPKDKPEIAEDSNWSKDQRERNYYYDDSHGYQKYVPDEDDED